MKTLKEESQALSVKILRALAEDPFMAERALNAMLQPESIGGILSRAVVNNFVRSRFAKECDRMNEMLDLAEAAPESMGQA